MSDAPKKTVVTGIFIDSTMTVKGQVGSDNTITWAVRKLQPDVARAVNDTFNLQPPLNPDEMQVKYFPSGAQPNAKLSDLGDMSFIAIFSPGEDQKDLIGNQMLTAPVQAPSMDSRMEGMMDAIKSLQTKIDEQAKVVESLQTKTDEQEKVVEKLRKELKKERDDRKGDIERLETRNEELEMRNGEQDGIIDSLHKDLKRERDDRMEDIEALKKVTLLITPLHLRVLLDLAQQKILHDLDCDTWENLRQNRNIHQLTDIIFRALVQPSCPSRETIEFLCSYNNVRKDGNMAAHSASQEEVKEAVYRKPIGSKDRRCLEEMYTYIFGDGI